MYISELWCSQRKSNRNYLHTWCPVYMFYW